MKQAIGIKFGDNDFGNTFKPLLSFISSLDRDYSKRELMQIINALAYGFYLIKQNNFEYVISKKETENYLKLSADNILQGKEVTEYIEYLNKTKNFNYSFFFVYPGRPSAIL